MKTAAFVVLLCFVLSFTNARKVVQQSTAAINNLNQEFLAHESNRNAPNPQAANTNKKVQSTANLNNAASPAPVPIAAHEPPKKSTPVVNTPKPATAQISKPVSHPAPVPPIANMPNKPAAPVKPVAHQQQPVKNSAYDQNYPPLQPSPGSNVKQLIQHYNTRDEEARRAAAGQHKYSEVVAGTHKRN